MRKINLLFSLIIICVLFTAIGYGLGKKGYEVNIKKTPTIFTIKNKTLENSNVDFTMFWNVWDDLNMKFVDKPVDSQKLVYGAIKGMVAAAGDPYTRYLDPEENKSNDEVLQGSYEGIGAELTMKDEVVTIVAAFDDSPAKNAGLRSGDMIIAVDKESTLNSSLSDVVKKIKGQKGTEVILTIAREKEKAFDVKIIRDSISVTTVKSEFKSDETLYIRISRFGEQTNGEWDSTINKAIVERPSFKNLIIDLRENPGGYLNSAVHIAGYFMKGTVVIERNFDGSEKRIDSKSNTVFTTPILNGKRTVILIDQGSASASEILAGALKEKANAYLIGIKSFGKGSVQEPIDYSDGSGLNVTIAKWYTPNGLTIHKKGIEPDKKVEITEQDLEDKKDPQLDSALEYLR